MGSRAVRVYTRRLGDEAGWRTPFVMCVILKAEA